MRNKRSAAHILKGESREAVDRKHRVISTDGIPHWKNQTEWQPVLPEVHSSLILNELHKRNVSLGQRKAIKVDWALFLLAQNAIFFSQMCASVSKTESKQTGMSTCDKYLNHSTILVGFI